LIDWHCTDPGHASLCGLIGAYPLAISIIERLFVLVFDDEKLRPNVPNPKEVKNFALPVQK
jgi:hypothetical protein